MSGSNPGSKLFKFGSRVTSSGEGLNVHRYGQTVEARCAGALSRRAGPPLPHPCLACAFKCRLALLFLMRLRGKQLAETRNRLLVAAASGRSEAGRTLLSR